LCSTRLTSWWREMFATAPPGKDSTMTMYKKDAGTGKWVKSFVMTYETK
jgi:hypothetical protein